MTGWTLEKISKWVYHHKRKQNFLNANWIPIPNLDQTACLWQTFITGMWWKKNCDLFVIRRSFATFVGKNAGNFGLVYLCGWFKKKLFSWILLDFTCWTQADWRFDNKFQLLVLSIFVHISYKVIVAIEILILWIRCEKNAGWKRTTRLCSATAVNIIKER